jgi:hypothetical protein
LAVKILTNRHNLLRNPLHLPICVLRKFIPHRVKVWRGCAHSIAFFPLCQIAIRKPLHPSQRSCQGKVILDFYSIKCLVRWIVGRIGKLGRDVVKTLIITNQLFMTWLSSPFIIRLFPYLDYHESVILQKTSLQGLILIIKSTYQGWCHALDMTQSPSKSRPWSGKIRSCTPLQTNTRI